MARLQLEDGRVLDDLAAIRLELAGVGVALEHWPLPSDDELRTLLGHPALAPEAGERLLAALEERFYALQERSGYRSRDLIALHPGTPNLDAGLAKFATPHTHADDEVRYVVDGEAVFGFVRPDASQVELTVEAEECITVPAGTEHWFHLTATRRVKAVRYFSGTGGWQPEYTATSLRFAAAVGR